MSSFIGLLREDALKWFNSAFLSRNPRGPREGASFNSLRRRYPALKPSQIREFVEFAADARRAGRAWNRSTRDDYAPSLDIIPDASRKQRKFGLRGPTVLEYQVRLKLCYYDGQGRLIREWSTRDTFNFDLHATREQVIETFQARWDNVPEIFRGSSLDKQQGESTVEPCGLVVDSIIRKIPE